MYLTHLFKECRLFLKKRSHSWKIDSKDKHMHKTSMIYRNSDEEHVCNSGTSLWNLGEEGKEKRMIEHQ
jgi:hypothetical protein